MGGPGSSERPGANRGGGDLGQAGRAQPGHEQPARVQPQRAQPGRGRLGRGRLGWIFGVALSLRLAYVAWAPDVLYGDPIFYSLYAEMIAAGHGFAEFDRSPAIFWMPGWPALLAAVYAPLGKSVRAAMLCNALLGALTALVLARLATTLTRRERVGWLAGLVYALWPGNVYYCAVLMSEVAFNCALVVALWAQVRALHDEGGRRALASGVAGLCFGLAAMVKAEPLVLVPVLLGHAWLALDRRAFARHALAWGLGLALVLGPWALRNWYHFDRLIVTSASGGTNFWIGNHLGGDGGNDLGHEQVFRQSNRRGTTAETNLAQSAAGWAEGLDFWRRHTGDALATLPNKLRLTYESDGGGVRNLAKQVERPTRLRLRAIADVYWFAVLALAVVGLWQSRAWPPGSRVLVLGIPAAWLVVHLVFIGGERFHVPETLALAILAAAGLAWLHERFAAKGGGSGRRLRS